MESGIIIYWDEALEVIEFDYENIDSIELVNSSSELWDSGEKLQYSIKPRIIKRDDDGIEVRIDYSKSNNPHIDPEDTRWGFTKLSIKERDNSGEARWFDDEGVNWSGNCRWVRIDAPLKSTKRRRIKTTKLQREQAQFRKLLINMDKKCVLSGESNQTVLEAAHIIAVSEGGPDIPSNGILLRCDLHKLYDNNAFKIADDGTVIIVDKLACGDDYTELLSGMEPLEPEILNRVQRALIEKDI